MKIIGIICEYNPLHRGHQKQLHKIREDFGGDCAIVCLMSGNFVQRGAPAIIDKSRRAEAAVACGADLVLELPVTYSLSSAEGFAAGGVSLLAPFCHWLCFGAETPNENALLDTAKALLSPGFSRHLRIYLDAGLSFPAARQEALTEMGLPAEILGSPNNILAVEYCKAILAQKSAMHPYPILREGSYHDTLPDGDNPSATAVRQLMTERKNWESYIPQAALPYLQDAPLHSLAAGERAVLGKLRTLSEEEFSRLPGGSEGLWRKFMRACRTESSMEAIAEATKSKRYTRSRINRMLMCAFLGITEEMLASPAPYTRVLALNARGGEVLKSARKTGIFLNCGEKTDHPYTQLENRCDSLYGLFACGGPEPPAQSRTRYIRL